MCELHKPNTNHDWRGLDLLGSGLGRWGCGRAPPRFGQANCHPSPRKILVRNANGVFTQIRGPWPLFINKKKHKLQSCRWDETHKICFLVVPQKMVGVSCTTLESRLCRNCISYKLWNKQQMFSYHVCFSVKDFHRFEKCFGCIPKTRWRHSDLLWTDKVSQRNKTRHRHDFLNCERHNPS